MSPDSRIRRLEADVELVAAHVEALKVQVLELAEAVNVLTNLTGKLAANVITLGEVVRDER